MLNGRRVKEGKSNRNEKLRCIDKMDKKKNNREEVEMGRYLVDGIVYI